MRDRAIYTSPDDASEEERLVAELELLGVRYLSRQSAYQAVSVRPPAELLADLIRQPSARVRLAAIAVLLARPNVAEAARAAIAGLGEYEALTLRLFYTAACLLQREHAGRLRPFLTGAWHDLPDMFSGDLGLAAAGTAGERLRELGAAHRRFTGAAVNWTGTYQDVAKRLLRRWELEQTWSR